MTTKQSLALTFDQVHQKWSRDTFFHHHDHHERHDQLHDHHQDHHNHKAHLNIIQRHSPFVHHHLFWQVHHLGNKGAKAKSMPSSSESIRLVVVSLVMYQGFHCIVVFLFIVMTNFMVYAFLGRVDANWALFLFFSNTSP